jgi:serine/threonine protein phosphatase 1
MAAIVPFSEPARIPPGVTVTAVGDVHGHLDLMEPYLDEAARRAAEQPERRHIVIMLGDLVDRGPDSSAVVERLVRGVEGCELVTLKGNHEDAMLAFLAGEPGGRAWLDFGGVTTLWSYGVDTPLGRIGPDELDMMRHGLIEHLPASHLDFLQRLAMSFVIGDYVFVHAGLRPGVPLERQSNQDLVWIREDFLRSTQRFEKKVVHGHTPVARPEFRQNRINLDTGAYATGRLTAALFEDETVRVL